MRRRALATNDRMVGIGPPVVTVTVPASTRSGRAGRGMIGARGLRPRALRGLVERPREPVGTGVAANLTSGAGRASRTESHVGRRARRSSPDVIAVTDGRRVMTLGVARDRRALVFAPLRRVAGFPVRAGVGVVLLAAGPSRLDVRQAMPPRETSRCGAPRRSHRHPWTAGFGSRNETIGSHLARRRHRGQPLRRTHPLPECLTQSRCPHRSPLRSESLRSPPLNASASTSCAGPSRPSPPTSPADSPRPCVWLGRF